MNAYDDLVHTEHNENSGLTLQSIANHSMLTYISMMRSIDEVSVVTFNTYPTVLDKMVPIGDTTKLEHLKQKLNKYALVGLRIYGVG